LGLDGIRASQGKQILKIADCIAQFDGASLKGAFPG